MQPGTLFVPCPMQFGLASACSGTSGTSAALSQSSNRLIICRSDVARVHPRTVGIEKLRKFAAHVSPLTVDFNSHQGTLQVLRLVLVVAAGAALYSGVLEVLARLHCFH